MPNRVVDLALRSVAASPVLCEFNQQHARTRKRGAMIVTTGPDRDLHIFMMHLHAAGIQHVTEVRRLLDANSSRSCTSDRRSHRFVEEVINGYLQKGEDDLLYQCVDVLDGDSVDCIVEKIESPDVNILAATPRAAEDLIPLTDSLATAMHLPLIGNDSNTTHLRIDKFEMQDSLRKLGVAKILQVQASSLQEAEESMREIGLAFPAVVKPVNSGGSDGVLLCLNSFDLSRALEINIDRIGVYNQVKKKVAIQEFLQGDEFVVNTVSLFGHHRVLDMWRVTKHVEGDRILYDHQILIADPNEYADVVYFSFAVLDAVEMKGGASHLEVVRTVDGMHLIEINPRQAGHSPRATRQLGENQLSALALAIGQPDLFVQQSLQSPHYTMRESDPELVMVIFLKASQDAEVHKNDLMAIVNLETFWRFDRVSLPMFTDLVKEANSDSFWICARTEGLFTVPLTVLLRGTESELRGDLERVRELERSMYRPFGTFDTSCYEGALEGGRSNEWYDLALGRIDLPAVGSRLQVLQGRSLNSSDGKINYYKEFDCGTVSKWLDDRIRITWDRSGLITAIAKLTWNKYFKVVGSGPMVPEVGCRLQALPGKTFLHETEHGVVEVYRDGDVGTVSSWNGKRLSVTWDRSGLASSISMQHWAETFKVVQMEKK